MTVISSSIGNPSSAATAEADALAETPEPEADPANDRVPVYCAGELAGFVLRVRQNRDPSGPASEQNSDAIVERAILAAIREECGIPTDHIGVSIAGGVARLSGEVANVHDKMSLRRIAASMEEVIAIIDDLWISRE
jgi:hypothetical protein